MIIIIRMMIDEYNQYDQYHSENDDWSDCGRPGHFSSPLSSRPRSLSCQSKPRFQSSRCLPTMDIAMVNNGHKTMVLTLVIRARWDSHGKLKSLDWSSTSVWDTILVLHVSTSVGDDYMTIIWSTYEVGVVTGEVFLKQRTRHQFASVSEYIEYHQQHLINWEALSLWIWSFPWSS